MNKPEYQRRHIAKKKAIMGEAVYLAYRAQLNREWIKKNRRRYNEAKAEYRFNLKCEVLALYSNGNPSCAFCGFAADVDALCLDHINDNGTEHRRELGISSRGANSGTTIYERVKAIGRIDGLQVLCANCNTIKELRRKRGGKTSVDMAQTMSVPRRWKQ